MVVIHLLVMAMLLFVMATRVPTITTLTSDGAAIPMDTTLYKMLTAITKVKEWLEISIPAKQVTLM